MKVWIVLASCTLGLLLTIAIGCAAPSGEAVGAERQAADGLERADLTAGQAVYDANCAGCHRAGRHDPEGEARDLIGKRITARLLSRHHGESLSEADAANLRAFLAGR